jgi:hypothetical protein
MRLAVTDDLISLIILNQDAEYFALSELLKDKTTLSNYLIRKFLKQNSGGVLGDLAKLEDPMHGLKELFGRAKK